MKQSERAAVRAAAELIGQGGVVALTGAGCSTESGIPDFRGKGGLWSRYNPNEYGTLGAFRRDAAKIWKMLLELYKVLDAEANAGHRALAHLETLGLIDGIITQNIDGLHQKAGSVRVVEFHGSPRTLSCLGCGLRFEYAAVRDLMPPRCSCGELLKPDMVFFDETIPPRVLEESDRLIHGARTLLVAGTSCQVVPAAYFPSMVHSRGGSIIEVNLEPALAGMATVTVEGGFSAVMQGIVELL